MHWTQWQYRWHRFRWPIWHRGLKLGLGVCSPGLKTSIWTLLCMVSSEIGHFWTLRTCWLLIFLLNIVTFCFPSLWRLNIQIESHIKCLLNFWSFLTSGITVLIMVTYIQNQFGLHNCHILKDTRFMWINKWILSSTCQWKTLDSLVLNGQ